MDIKPPQHWPSWQQEMYLRYHLKKDELNLLWSDSSSDQKPQLVELLNELTDDAITRAQIESTPDLVARIQDTIIAESTCIRLGSVATENISHALQVATPPKKSGQSAYIGNVRRAIASLTPEKNSLTWPHNEMSCTMNAQWNNYIAFINHSMQWGDIKAESPQDMARARSIPHNAVAWSLAQIFSNQTSSYTLDVTSARFLVTDMVKTHFRETSTPKEPLTPTEHMTIVCPIMALAQVVQSY